MKNNLPIPFPSTLDDDVDSLCNWMREYQDYYDTHIEDEKIKRTFTFTLVKFINELTFALEKEGMGPRTQKAVEETLAYLSARDKDTGKPLMRYFEVKWKSSSSVQVKAETEREAIEKAIILAKEDPQSIVRYFGEDSNLEAEEVQF